MRDRWSIRSQNSILSIDSQNSILSIRSRNSVLHPGQKIIWDNLSVHKSVAAEDLIKAAECEVTFLPPYSPDFNPIEQAFSKLEAHLRRANQRTVDGLWEAIGDGLNQITATDARGWFQHCGYPVDGQ